MVVTASRIGLLLMVAATCWAHDPITTKLVYTKEISRIFQKRCVSCHQEGGSAPMPLTNYMEVRPWAVAIKEQVLRRAMPPWGAVKGFGDFSPDLGLTQEEIAIVSAWVLGGAPEGDPLFLAESTKAEAEKLKPLGSLTAVDTRIVLTKPFRLTAIEPQPAKGVDSIRITAKLPGGRTVPLLWLKNYNAEWKQAFRFRQPLQLPAGTVIQASAPLRFQLAS